MQEALAILGTDEHAAMAETCPLESGTTASAPPGPLDRQAIRHLKDEELGRLVRDENDEAAYQELSRRFQPLISGIVQSYFLVGGDRDDLLQEGMIGLMKACRSWQDEKRGRVTFKGFVRKCVTRQVYTAIKAHTRAKHQILNEAVSLHAAPTTSPSGDGDRSTLIDLLPEQRIRTPEEILIARELTQARIEFIRQCLSERELKIVIWRLHGKSYEEIAQLENIDRKAVDNAYQRFKQKARAYGLLS